ncbi:uncharacterized protein KY384_007983 [Bacidia gigantensis]|uniref:uncharacterized protein n=1 Tax=Bacidia gigantensis TaxID=2732470 RepID=UPI001D04CC1D|nr:uncharacterized protein KY384_007983 [Bacidia gigantensis]KAG8527239.1 hypothetical protein KY384_007983 [Bacidia gigantensis]
MNIIKNPFYSGRLSPDRPESPPQQFESHREAKNRTKTGAPIQILLGPGPTIFSSTIKRLDAFAPKYRQYLSTDRHQVKLPDINPAVWDVFQEWITQKRISISENLAEDFYKYGAKKPSNEHEASQRQCVILCSTWVLCIKLDIQFDMSQDIYSALKHLFKKVSQREPTLDVLIPECFQLIHSNLREDLPNYADEPIWKLLQSQLMFELSLPNPPVEVLLQLYQPCLHQIPHLERYILTQFINSYREAAKDVDMTQSFRHLRNRTQAGVPQLALTPAPVQGPESFQFNPQQVSFATTIASFDDQLTHESDQLTHESDQLTHESDQLTHVSASEGGEEDEVMTEPPQEEDRHESEAPLTGVSAPSSFQIPSTSVPNDASPHSNTVTNPALPVTPAVSGALDPVSDSRGGGRGGGRKGGRRRKGN